MGKYEFNVSVWYDESQWFYSVIQEVNGEPEVLAYGSDYDPKVAVSAITDTIQNLEL